MRIGFVLIFILLLTQIAEAGFQTSRIGSNRGLAKTPIGDQIDSLQDILDDPNSPLTNDIFTSLNIDVTPFGASPLDQHDLLYIKHILQGVDVGDSLNEVQTAFDDALTNNPNVCPNGNCGKAAADWLHEQVAVDPASPLYNDWNQITPAVIDDLIGNQGYTNRVLQAGGETFSDLLNDLDFQTTANLPGQGNTPAPSVLKDHINRVSGFVDEVAADPSALTPTDYSTAQALVDAFFANSDYPNFSLTTFLACYNDADSSRSGGANSCTVTASHWAQASDVLFINAQRDLADGITLSLEQLQELGLDTSPLDNPLATWQLEYINNLLSQAPNDLNQWQTAITDSADTSSAEAARWKTAQVAADNAEHTPSEITVPLLETAVEDPNYVSTILASNPNTDIGSLGRAFDNATLATSPTADSIKEIIRSHTGFTSENSYQAYSGSANRGAFTPEAWEACYASTYPQTGGVGSCSATRPLWNQIAAIDLPAFIGAVRSIYDIMLQNGSQTGCGTDLLPMDAYCTQMQAMCSVSPTASDHTSNATLQEWMACGSAFSGRSYALTEGRAIACWGYNRGSYSFFTKYCRNGQSRSALSTYEIDEGTTHDRLIVPYGYTPGTNTIRFGNPSRNLARP